MPLPPRFALLPALALLAACATHETPSATPAATPAASSVPPAPPPSSPPLTGALGAPIAPIPPEVRNSEGIAGGTTPPTAPAPVAMPGKPVRMSANEITAALSNNSVRGVTTEGKPYMIYFAGNGHESFRQADFRDSGTWRVLPDGRLCSSLARVSDDTQQCYIMYRSGKTLTFQSPEGVTVGNVTVVPGNPERL
jgi:hypothetical protein